MLLVIFQFCKMWVNIEICVAYWQFDQKYLCLYVSQYFHNFFHANIFGLACAHSRQNNKFCKIHFRQMSN